MKERACGYDVIRSAGELVTWGDGLIPLVIRMDTASVLQDGTNHATSVQAAAQAWNQQLARVQFGTEIAPAGYAGSANGVNEIVFDLQLYSNEPNPESFPAQTLAVTISYITVPRENGTRRLVHTDILFNRMHDWDSYRGSLQAYTFDIRRVAIHELGHVLGLDHPDEAGQSVEALMNSMISGIDALRDDDLTGAQWLYGRPGGFTRPANDDFVHAELLSGSLSMTTVGATAEAGEPAHVPGEIGGSSIWCKWTAPSNGTVRMRTFANFDTMIAAYSGRALENLTQLASNDDVERGVVRTSVVTFAVETDKTYYLAVDGWSGEWGPVTVTLSFDPSNDLAPAVSSYMSSALVEGQALEVEATVQSGTPPFTYQWQRQRLGATNWQDLSDTPPFSGVNSPTLRVSAMDVSMAGDRFRIRVVGPGGIGYWESVGARFVPAAPVITAQPQSCSAADIGQEVRFATRAAGSPPLSYQWYHDGAPIPGATQSEYLIAQATRADAGGYKVRVANSLGAVESNVVALGFGPEVTLSGARRRLLRRGESLAMSVSAQGLGPLTYQWRRNGVPIDGATEAELRLERVTLQHSGRYDVSVGDSQGATRSDSVFVVVAPRATSVRVWGADAATVALAPDLPPLVDLLVSQGGILGITAEGSVTVVGGSPQLPAGLHDVVQLAGSSNHTLALRADGSVVGWGSNAYNQTKVPAGLSKVIAIAAGSERSLALLSDGTVVQWGRAFDLFGAIQQPAGAYDWGAISLSDAALALNANGTVSAWGGNPYKTADVPPGLTDVTAVCAGLSSAAVKKDGTLVMWGGLDRGQRNIPGDLPPVIAISNRFHALALLHDGSLRGWGEDIYGLLQMPGGLERVMEFETGSRYAVALQDVEDDLVIWRQSESVRAALGASAKLQVIAYPREGLVYQWKRNGVPILGQNGATLLITAVGADDYGTYAVEISQSDRMVLSQAIQLIPAPMAQTIDFTPLADRFFTSSPVVLHASATSALPVSFEVVAGPAVMEHGSLVLTGTGQVHVRATQIGDAHHGAAPPVDRMFWVWPGIAFWSQQVFSAEQQGDVLVSGPAADPDGDGLNNLLEYALGLSPTQPDADDLAPLTTAASELVYTYQRPVDRADIVYAVEVSADLEEWTEEGVTHEWVATEGDRATWRARHPRSSGPLFFRLKVTVP